MNLFRNRPTNTENKLSVTKMEGRGRINQNSQINRYMPLYMTQMNNKDPQNEKTIFNTQQ